MIWSKNLQPPEFLGATRFSMLQEEFSPVVVQKCLIKPNSKVLEVGCGTGCFSKFLSKSTSNVRYVGLERDKNFVKVHEQVQENNSFEIVQGNAYEMPFENESFDTVVSHTFFNCIEFPDIAIREMKRVAKEGAVVASVTPVSNAMMLRENGVYPENCNWCHELKLLEENFLLCLEKIGIGPNSLNRGIKTKKIPSFFKESGLGDVTTLPLAYSFSLSDAKYDRIEKEYYIENIFKGDCARIDGALEMEQFSKIFSELQAQKYKNLLRQRYDFWKEHIDDNNIWEWSSAISVLVAGLKK